MDQSEPRPWWNEQDLLTGLTSRGLHISGGLVGASKLARP